MNYIKNYFSNEQTNGLKSSGVVFALLFLLLSGFGSAPIPGELSLEFGDQNDANKVTFTKWRFVHYEFPSGKLNRLKFTAHVRPQYHTIENDIASKRIEAALDEMGSQNIILEVYDTEKVGKNQFEAKAYIEVNSIKVDGTFYFKPSTKDHYSFEGRFETNGNKLNREYHKHDFNFNFKAYIPKKS